MSKLVITLVLLLAAFTFFQALSAQNESMQVMTEIPLTPLN